MVNKGCGSYTKIQNYTSISLKLCLPGKKNTEIWGVNIYHFNITLIILLYMGDLSKFNLYSVGPPYICI